MKKNNLIVSFLLVMVLISLSACGSGSTTTSSKTTPAPTTADTAAKASEVPKKKSSYLIGMSQANLGEPWRVAMNDQIAAAAAKHPELKVVYADAAQDNSKQIADVENFIQQKIDLLIISPNEAKPLTAVVKKAYDAGIPVIVLDRKVEGDAYTMYIGGNNKLIGKKAGEYVAKILGDKGGNVVEVKGLEGATPQQERHDGFMEGIKSNPNVKVIASQNGDWLKDKSITVMESILQANKKIDIVYGHNDPAAEGAFIAAKNAKRETEMKFIGIDALPTPDGGIKAVMEGRLTATYVYPTGGKDAIDNAIKILENGEKVEKSITLDTLEVTKENAADVYKQFGGK
ncbi:substrate-binding domain-containing protein [Paenibacillus sp. Root444D2]|uniref:substrate-binding domain-containing protein n=1 Tax=Paenibacillus sp. Root444D2 TaxID=1736538 RepID=UPI000709BA28|nr:substrate-binding domain-containing protein [Paenibacillus sp. Root444D2]KQX62647.1 ABC transporter substrate-binding protein [Paenibacillus sp. Root444D2]